MSELLTSEEIVALLAACGCEDTKDSKPKISNYDFKNPDLYNDKFKKTVLKIHQRYANTLADSLQKSLNAKVFVEYTGTEKLRMADYIRTCDNNISIANLSLLPGNFEGFLDLSSNISTSFVDIITGGDGESSDQELTDVDRAVLSKLFQSIVITYQSVWNCEIGITIDDFETFANYHNPELYSENMYVCNYEVLINNNSGILSIGIQEKFVERIASEINNNTSSPISINQTPEMRSILQSSVENIPVPCKAVLGRTVLTMEDVLNLQAGDIIKLDEVPDKSIELWINESHAYNCILGKKGNSIGLKVKSSI